MRTAIAIGLAACGAPARPATMEPPAPPAVVAPAATTWRLPTPRPEQGSFVAVPATAHEEREAGLDLYRFGDREIGGTATTIASAVIDVDARAFVVRGISLDGCTVQPEPSPGWRIEGTAPERVSLREDITPPPLVWFAEPNLSAVAVFADRTFACGDPAWRAWLAQEPLASITSATTVQIQPYHRLDRGIVDTNLTNRELPQRGIAGRSLDLAAGSLVVQPDKEIEGFEPAPPTRFIAVAIQLVELAETSCRTTFKTGRTAVPYETLTRSDLVRPVLVPRTTRPVLVRTDGLLDPRWATRVIDRPPPADISCRDDLTPKYARTLREAHLLGVTDELIAPHAVDFTKQVIVVFARPRELELIEQAGSRLDLELYGTETCPPPAHRTEPPLAIASNTAPRTPRYAEIAFVIPRGTQVQRVGSLACVPPPTPTRNRR